MSRETIIAAASMIAAGIAEGYDLDSEEGRDWVADVSVSLAVAIAKKAEAAYLEHCELLHKQQRWKPG